MEDGDELDHGPGLTPEAVEGADFATVRRGYEPETVRARLSEAAGEIRRLSALVGSLSERVSELEDTPSAKLESGRVAEALGDEAARVLQTAREAAQARMDQTGAECDRMIGQAKATASSIVEDSRTEGREMVVEARKVRERILSDMAGKRHEHRVEVEQLRVMRDRFLEALTICRQGLDRWMEELAQAEPQAAAAAERAGQRVAAESESTVGEIEAEIKAGRLVGLPLASGSEEAVAGDTAPADAEPDGAAAGEVPHPESAADAPEPDDADGLEDLDESEELDEYVEIVGYPKQVSAPGSVGLYDVEAEPDSDFGSGLDPEPGAEPVLTEDPALGVSDAGRADAQTAPPPADADAIFARLRSITDQSIHEPAQPTEGVEPATDAAHPPDQDAEALTVEESVGQDDIELDAEAQPAPAASETSEPDDLVSAARAVAVGGIARRLKRMVVDEQGNLLDGIRRSGARAVHGITSADASHYTRAARVPMQDFASDIDVSIDDVDLKAAGDAIVSMLVESVRARLGELLEETEDPDELSSGVRSIYREARSRQAEDAAQVAFTAGWPEPIT